MVVLAPPPPEQWAAGYQMGFLNGSEQISGCLDYVLQRTAAVGDFYRTENCEYCLCSPVEKMCKQVSCAPPEDCKNGYFKKDPADCCDVCVTIERPPDEWTSLNLKLGVLAVIAFLVLTLLMFVFHRLRSKRLLTNLRRCDSRPTLDGSAMTMESGVGPRVSVDGYVFPHSPPTYVETETALGPVSEPPPPYPGIALQPASQVSLSSSSSDSDSSSCSCSCCESAVSLESLDSLPPTESVPSASATADAVSESTRGSRRRRLKKLLFHRKKCKRRNRNNPGESVVEAAPSAS